MSRIAIFNLYWNTLGGGEVAAGALAERLAADHEVTLLGPHTPDAQAFSERLDIDLSGCRFARAVDDDQASAESADHDVFINHTWMSKARARSATNVYMVMFPGNPRRLRSRVKSGACRLGYGLSTLGARVTSRFDPFARGFERRIHRSDWVGTYQHLWANSPYTAHWTHRLGGRSAEVLYPPVGHLPTPADKTRTILSVGRFFPESVGHCKRQLDLVEAFRRLHESGRADGWRLVLAGGCEPVGREYYLAVRRAAVGLPVDVLVNVPGSRLTALYGEAAIYWHATGFGRSPRRLPIAFEHFGISVVEAMAAGAVPLVLETGGPSTTVRDLVEGRHWGSIDDLVDRTAGLIADPGRLERLRRNGFERAGGFGRDSFGANVDRMVAAFTGRETA